MDQICSNYQKNIHKKGCALHLHCKNALSDFQDISKLVRRQVTFRQAMLDNANDDDKGCNLLMKTNHIIFDMKLVKGSSETQDILFLQIFKANYIFSLNMRQLLRNVI